MSKNILKLIKTIHVNLKHLQVQLKSNSSASQIDELANNLVYSQIDKMIHQLSFNPNDNQMRVGLINTNQNFQTKYGIDFGFHDIPSNTHSWRNRDWVQDLTITGKEAQGLTAPILNKYIQTIDDYLTHLIKIN